MHINNNYDKVIIGNFDKIKKILNMLKTFIKILSFAILNV